MKYLIFGLEPGERKAKPIAEGSCPHEAAAIKEGIRLFREKGLQRVVIVEESMKVIFRDTRICGCRNIQMHLDGKWKCGACGVAVKRVEEIK